MEDKLLFFQHVGPGIKLSSGGGQVPYHWPCLLSFFLLVVVLHFESRCSSGSRFPGCTEERPPKVRLPKPIDAYR